MFWAVLALAAATFVAWPLWEARRFQGLGDGVTRIEVHSALQTDNDKPEVIVLSPGQEKRCVELLSKAERDFSPPAK